MSHSARSESCASRSIGRTSTARASFKSAAAVSAYAPATSGCTAFCSRFQLALICAVDAAGSTASTAYRSTKGTRLTYARTDVSDVSASFSVLREERSERSESERCERCERSEENPARRDDARPDRLVDDDATGPSAARPTGRPRNARGRSRAAARSDARAERRSIALGEGARRCGAVWREMGRFFVLFARQTTEISQERIGDDGERMAKC